MMHFAEYASPVGNLLLGSDGQALTQLKFGGKPEGTPGNDAVLQSAKVWLDAYFRGEELPLEISLAPEGTPFQKQVWQCLLEIPWGQTRTYGEIAREMASRMGKQTMSAQAVGQAVGKNPIAILIPCHRVVGSGGKLTGYAWGLERKQWLLDHERRENGRNDQ